MLYVAILTRKSQWKGPKYDPAILEWTLREEGYRPGSLIVIGVCQVGQLEDLIYIFQR